MEVTKKEGEEGDMETQCKTHLNLTHAKNLMLGSRKFAFKTGRIFQTYKSIWL